MKSKQAKPRTMRAISMTKDEKIIKVEKEMEHQGKGKIKEKELDMTKTAK